MANLPGHVDHLATLHLMGSNNTLLHQVLQGIRYLTQRRFDPFRLQPPPRDAFQRIACTWIPPDVIEDHSGNLFHLAVHLTFRNLVQVQVVYGQESCQLR